MRTYKSVAHLYAALAKKGVAVSTTELLERMEALDPRRRMVKISDHAAYIAIVDNEAAALGMYVLNLQPVLIESRCLLDTTAPGAVRHLRKKDSQGSGSLK